MDSEFTEPRRKHLGCIEALMIVALLAIFAILSVPRFSQISEKGNITKGISNCRQVIMSLRLYSADNDGKFPDTLLPNPGTSNEVFRVLFTEGVIDNESIFGCPLSPFQPDDDTEMDIDFIHALQRGENHWATTAGLTDSHSGNIPLVFENPAHATWPPTWNTELSDQPKRGRAWGNWNGSIIVGLNDTSVSLQRLEGPKRDSMPLKKVPGTPGAPPKDLFEAAIDAVRFPVGRVLDIEE